MIARCAIIIPGKPRLDVYKRQFLYQGFFKGLPNDIEEAAMIDGCGPWKCFWVVVFPLLKPITTTIIIFEVMWVWNDFLYPYLFLSSNKSFTLVMQVYKGVGQFSNCLLYTSNSLSVSFCCQDGSRVLR